MAPLLCTVAFLAFGGETAYAQSDPIIQTVRTFSPVLSGTTDVVIDPAATYLDVTVTFTDINPDPLGSKPISAFGFQENGLPTGWTSTGDGFSAIPQPTPPTGGNFYSGWFYINIPTLPFSFTYRLNTLAALTDLYEFSGATSYHTDGDLLISQFDDTQTISPIATFLVYRSVIDGYCQMPSQYANDTTLTVQLTIKAIGDMSAATELGLIEVVPDAWLVNPSSVSGANVPESIQINPSGNLEVSYTSTPEFPASFIYQIAIPALELGTKTFSTYAQYRLDAGNPLVSQTKTTHLVNTAPTLFYKGIAYNNENDPTIQCGTLESTFKTSWRAIDTEEGNLSSKIVIDSSSIDFNVLGSYPINISVSDSCGNTTSAANTISVVDTSPPLVSLIGYYVTIDCGTIYLDAGATAWDTCEGDLSNAITVVSTVPNPATPGCWTVTYTASDSKGNIGSIFRGVKVFDNCIGVVEGEDEGDPIVSVSLFHSADINANNIIDLTELLRMIQLFNFQEIHCDATSADGFAPGYGDQTCTPHSSDFNPQNWDINLDELLRIVQIFNIGGYFHCPCFFVNGGLDGFCAGLN